MRMNRLQLLELQKLAVLKLLIKEAPRENRHFGVIAKIPSVISLWKSVEAKIPIV